MTIKDIARMSGCSVATVSRVLNGRPDVSEETRSRVLAVVKDQDFQPNSNAKHLKRQSGTSIAIIVNGIMNMLFADLVEQLQTLLHDAGQDTSVYYLDEDDNEVAFAYRLCRERQPRGIIFLGGSTELFQEGFAPISVPCVLLTNDGRELGFDNLSSFTTDDGAAAEQAIEFLVSRGHRSIGLLGGNWACSQISMRRLVGCKNACQRLDIPFDDRQCEPCRYSLPDAYAATRRLLERCPDLTAIFAVSDVMALGAIRALQDMGKRVPDDISVIGFDGISTGQYSVPRLATVRQDTKLLAEKGVDALLRGIAFNSRRPVHELVPFRLIEGESVMSRPN